KRKSRWDETP
nr:Chain C, Splicing factor 3B subunit 1 [synthetic construct]2PEH_D Chain D, Splicing factor 3B subunit 1 [synthetic construct]4OZ1_C Chain C, Splicing factor 3B subunit 1 [Homo sapiens]